MQAVFRTPGHKRKARAKTNAVLPAAFQSRARHEARGTEKAQVQLCGLVPSAPDHAGEKRRLLGDQGGYQVPPIFVAISCKGLGLTHREAASTYRVCGQRLVQKH